MPTEIGQLSVLMELELSCNRLTSLPPEIAQLSKLKKLRLDENELTSLPPEFGSLSALRELYFSGNQLRSLPPEILKLVKLEVLWLYDNELTKLPPEFGRLSALKKFSLANNRLTNLPAEIGELKELELLNLEYNALEALPESLRELRKLKRLALHGNEALGLPANVLGRAYSELNEKKPPAKPQDLLDYYFAALGDRGQALREMKVLVVGRGGAGKTSVIRRLKGLPLDTLQSETHGIAIEELSLPCADGPVVARVWDFGGQHVLHAMHEFFFTGRSLYVLVLGEREDMAERDAEYWLQLIRSYAGKAPVIVVLNKSGGRARELDLPRRKLEDTYGPILAWLPTECHETDPERGGISVLKQQITRVIGAMPEIQARFPKKWMQIKEWLSGMKESYLDYNTYEQRCSVLGETDSEKQEELAAFLHDLGVALNYRRDPRLHETTVLRPDWLADGIYALLRANDTRHPSPLAPDGRINLKRMPAIYVAAENLKMLKAADYPAVKHPFLLRLMAAFQLSFPLDEEGMEHLVPALLSVEEPEGRHWSPEDAGVNLRWEFPVVPGPLMPRLLVRTFGLVLEDWLWRRGAIYAYGAAIGKIWEDKERYIYLSVTLRDHATEVEAADDLVRMIRGTLREIVSEYKNLTVQEQVRWHGDWLPRRAAEALGLCEADDEEENPNQKELS
ncbi:MAG: leucine-rich repeat domain-containing protein [Verrucomicrobia bacterium]|nr:leucine-rich repeat domain-containing protein [Verrucomicrobiota bacterium]